MDSNLNTNISLFPNPPKHYKNFIREDVMSPPDINFLNKVSSFMSFGKEYKTNERNMTNAEVDTNFLRQFDQSIIESKNIPNRNIFQDPNVILANLIVENLNIDIFDAIDDEVKFIKKTYKELLGQITILENFELNSILIKFSFQKIYFFISLLKKKKIFIDVITYFNKEIENNTELENIFSKNLENCQNLLQSGLKKVKDDI
jgi:hypothetical protein